MIDFTYFAPTKVVFGKDTENTVGMLAREFGAKRVLIHYGMGSVIRSGLLDKVKTSLSDAGLEYELLGGVVPNPRLSLVYKGIKLARSSNIDFILAVGGGSVIDSAKAIAVGMKTDFDVWDLYTKGKEAVDCTPIGTILTISAAGSEMSGGSVITNENGWLKRSYGNEMMRPKFSILNPELTYTLPPYQTACGAADMMMHTMERYFTTEEPMEITDNIAVALIKTVMANIRKALDNPNDYNARAELMWASSLAHNGLTGCGGIGDWATHDIEHELGGMFDVAHGAGLSAIWSSWARHVYKVKPERFVKFAKDIFGIESEDKEDAVLTGIHSMELFYRSIGMPASVGEMGIKLTASQIEELAHKGTDGDTKTLGHFKKLNKKDLKAIFTLAR
ncbi:MAG: iron-containing alcohol dehydrogenase [Clostridia bacterium]|nr:iron-containing alcohol dehydrogenase [Clostridia bacterium]